MKRTPVSAEYTVEEDWEQRPNWINHQEVAGVTVDRADNVYLLTRRPARVVVYTRDGLFVHAWGEGMFTDDRTHGITACESGGILCVDDGDHTVRKFTESGELIWVAGISGEPSRTGYDGASVASINAGGEPFNRPTNVAEAPSGDLFVADGYGNARVHHFSADGELIKSWGEPGTGPGQFNLVHGIAALPDGRLLVADRENDRIQIFGQKGDFIDMWDDVQRPTQVAYDRRNDRVVVSELGCQEGQVSFTKGKRANRPSRLSIFDTGGSLLDRWGGDRPEAAGSFLATHDAVVDSEGSIYVAEVIWTIGASRGLSIEGVSALQKFLQLGPNG
jgi:sugar lactone lactonase YvrE